MRCEYCGAPAEASCAWIVRYGFPPADPALPLREQPSAIVPIRCDRPVCFRHLRELGNDRAHCVEHWRLREIAAPAGGRRNAGIFGIYGLRMGSRNFPVVAWSADYWIPCTPAVEHELALAVAAALGVPCPGSHRLR